MNLAQNIDLGLIVAALRPLEKVHVTLYGERKGFFMIGANRMEWANHEGCGRTGTAWKHNELAAVAVVVRDEVNASVLTCYEVKPGIN